MLIKATECVHQSETKGETVYDASTFHILILFVKSTFLRTVGHYAIPSEADFLILEGMLQCLLQQDAKRNLYS